MAEFHGWATHGPGQKLDLYSFDPGPLGSEEVEIAVEYCGLCHVDLSIVNNDLAMSQYPVIPGHEAVGKIVDMDGRIKGLKIGQRVGVAWKADRCMQCHVWMTGNNNLCTKALPPIVGLQGGFADRVRAHRKCTIPLPDALDIASAGTLLCSGITVFSPLVTFGIKPTDRIGIVGTGCLGNLGLKFANAWGCEVTAFTSHESKPDEAKESGAHHVVSNSDSGVMQKIASSLDMLMVTINTPLDWEVLVKTLKPNGRLHVLSAVLEPMPIPAIDLTFGQKNVSSLPTCGTATMETMLDFAARHNIALQVEHFPMSKVNEAIEHLAAGKARNPIIFDADFV